MESTPPSYLREFWSSPHHRWLALATLGVGFVSAQVLGLIVGATAYTLGWIYLPDMPFFRRWVDGRREEAKRVAALAQVHEFIRRRDAQLQALSSSRRQRYHELAAVCQSIEQASAENPLMAETSASDPRLRKLDELMWTYLRLLTIEESLDRFLEVERRDNLPAALTDSKDEVERLQAEVKEAEAKGGAGLEVKQRYLSSRMEHFQVMQKRVQRSEQAHDNLALVRSEQERLDQQIKLIRADAVAMKNTQSLTARIDATVEHLDQTNKWLSQLDEFRDVVGDLPATELRVGFGLASPPPLHVRREPPSAASVRTR
jgi:hypothetical protein